MAVGAASGCLLFAASSTAVAQESLRQAWVATGPPGSWAIAVAVPRNDQPVVLGGICPSTGGDCELHIARYHKNNGSAIWDVTLDDGDDSFDDPGGIAILPNGDPVVAATRCDSSFNNCRMHVLRLRGIDGSRIFGAAYGPPGNRNSGADIAVGPNGDLYASGVPVSRIPIAPCWSSGSTRAPRRFCGCRPSTRARVSTRRSASRSH